MPSMSHAASTTITHHPKFAFQDETQENPQVAAAIQILRENIESGKMTRENTDAVHAFSRALSRDYAPLPVTPPAMPPPVQPPPVRRQPSRHVPTAHMPHETFAN